MDREGEAEPFEKVVQVIGLAIQFLTLAVEREMREAAEDEDERLHDEQYPGIEIEVWYYTDDFISKWT